MDAPEQVVTGLLVALRTVDRILAERTGELMLDPEWSGVTFELEVTEMIEGSDSRLGFWGYVDGEKARVGGFGWIFDVLRDGNGWTIDRSLNLNANTTRYQETVAELPRVICADTRELRDRLPGLVSELLELPAIQPAEGE